VQSTNQRSRKVKVLPFVPDSAGAADASSQSSEGDASATVTLSLELAQLLQRKAELGGASNKAARGRVNKKIVVLQERMSTGTHAAKQAL
jgi:hypothetical protein